MNQVQTLKARLNLVRLTACNEARVGNKRTKLKLCKAGLGLNTACVKRGNLPDYHSSILTYLQIQPRSQMSIKTRKG